MKLSVWLPLGSALCALAAQQTAEIHLTKASVKRTGVLPEFLYSKTLYWFGQFDVGAAKNLTMLIDTGSAPLAVDPGRYKPTGNMKEVAGNYSFTYEGVGRQGFGFETVNATIVEDAVTGAGLTVAEQGIFKLNHYHYEGIKSLGYAIQHDGIVGMGGGNGTAPGPNGTTTRSWFYNLCHHKTIAACRFGLAYGTDGKGMAIIGKLASRLFKGSLVTVPFVDKGYFNFGDVYVNGKFFAGDQLFIMDEGTNNIQAPLSTTHQIFSELGFTSRLMKEQDAFRTHFPDGKQTYPKKAKFLTGYFECDKPPVLGFGFPPRSNLTKGQTSTVFNVSTSLWDVTKNGNNNCTSILAGTNFLGTKASDGVSAWLLGQPFFAGRYIDFNVGKQQLGYADLKNPTDPTL